MKKMVENSKTARKRFENGSETARKRLVNVGHFLAVLLVLLTIGIGNVWGAELTYTHDFTTKPSSGDNILSTITWTTSNINNLNNYNNDYAGVQVGTSKATGSITFTSKNNWGAQTSTSYYGYTKVKYVYVWLNNGSGTISATVTIGGKAATKSGTVSKNTSTGDDYTKTSKLTFTPASDGKTGQIVIAVSTSSKAGYVAAIQVVCEQPSSECSTLSAPGSPSSTPGATSVDLSWSSVANSSGYLVTFDGTDYNIASGTTTKTITGLKKEKTYAWTVAAKGDGETYCTLGTATSEQSVTTLDGCSDSKVTYTVASTSSVTPTDAPTGTSATYSSTYGTLYQLTSGNSMTLTLTGYAGKKIKGLTLSMRSNASSGAGTFSMAIGSTTVASISSATNFNAWYDNDSYGTDYRKVHVTLSDEVTVGVDEDIVITIAATANSLYCQAFSLCYSSCISLGAIGGAVEFTDPTTAVLTWNNIDNVDSWTAKWKTGAGSYATTNVSAITTNGAGKKTCTVTGLSCNTSYDFIIIATPDDGYCDKEEELTNKNSGKWDLDYTFSGASLKDGDLDEGTGVLCGDLDITIEPLSLAYELPSDVTVTIGGNSKTKGTDYTWDSSTGELYIDGEDIDGAVAINCTASLVGCLADPSIGAVSLKTGGTFNLGQVDVTVATSGTGSATCAWTDYGFVWSESANPTVGGSGCTKVAVGSDGSATTWNGSLTKTSFATGTTYYYRAYGKNSKDGANFVYSSSDGTFTPRSVAFNSNGGSSVDTKYVNSGTATSAPSAPTKTGYTFDSWRTTSGLTTAMDFSGTITKDTTLYAKWTANTYTVTISKNYGAAATKDYTATYDADMPSLSDFAITRGGYKLAGIFDDPDDGEGKKYYNADKTSAATWDKIANTTLYAHWTPNNYTITLDNHDADTGHEGTDKIAVTYDSNTNLSGTPAITVPEKDGYAFCGYYTAEDGGGSLIIDADGNVVASVSGYTSATKQWIKAGGDVTLHAYWKEVHTVTWYVDGEEWTSGTVTGNTSVVDGEKVSALPTAPTKSDCDDAKVFMGWRATEIDGVSISEPSGIFTTQAGSPEITDDMTFHAVFADRSGGDNTLVTNVSELTNGTQVYLYAEFVADETTYGAVAKAFASGNNVKATSGSVSGNKLTPGENAGLYTIGEVTVSEKKYYTFNDGTYYLRATGTSNNYLTGAASLGDDEKGLFSISISAGVFSISCKNTDVRGVMQFNKNGDTGLYDKALFNCYASADPEKYSAIQLFKKNPYVYSNYVTTCAVCTAAPTFNGAPTISDRTCEGATVTATNGLETLGEGDGCNIREYGFVWGTTATPTVASNTGKYTVSDNIDVNTEWDYDITELTKGTQYYVRAYAVNKSGTAYSDAVSFYTQGVSSIELTQAPAKTKYIAGETFDPAGMEITATMASGDEVDVTADVTYSESALTSGTNQDFDITYSLCDVDKEVTQTIDVYTLTVTEGTNPSYGEVSASGALITVTPTSGNIGVPTVTSDNAELRDNNDNTYTVINPTGNVAVTVNYREAGPTVVHYYVNGAEITSLKGTPTEGSSFDLPDASAVATAIAAQSVSSPDPTNYPNFWGWSRTPVHPQSTDPDVLSGSTKVYTETSFYAVYTNMSKIRIDESDITYTGYASYSSGALSSTFGGKSFTYYNILKVNTYYLQFKKASSDYGYIYNSEAISYIKHVNIGASGSNDDVKVFACSDDEGTISGSALSDADTRDDAYVYFMPDNTQYFIIKGDNSATYKIDYIDIYYGSGEELYMTTFKNVFNPTAASGNWSSTANWEDGVLPNIHEEVWIKKPVTVNVTDAQAKSIVIDQSSGNTGSITIPAGKALVVAETVKKTTDGETLEATEVADLHIGSSSTGNGSLVMGSHDGTNKAQVDFYTKARKTAENNWVNQYIGTPFNVADGRGVKEDYYGSYLYSFDFGTQSWVNIKDEDYHFTPFLGYNIIRKDAAEATLEMQGTLVATTNQSPTVYFKTDKAHSENVLANSWTAPIKIANFDATPSTGDFTNVEATIYIFNAGGAADAADDKTLAGQYSTYSVGTAGSAVIPSMQSFSVYATAAAPSLTLNYARLVYNPAVAGIAVQPNYAPRRMKAAALSEEMQPIRLRVSGESGYADELKIYLHEDFSDAFENGWDAHKMYGYPETPQLYAVTDDGELAILCAPDADATLLGFKAGEADTEYTFTFRYDSDEPLFLLDMQNNTYTEVQTGNAYTFQTSDVGAHNRFVLTRFAPQTPTDIEPTSDSSLKGREAATKLIIDNRIYILLRGVLYDATGKRVRVTNERVNE